MKKPIVESDPKENKTDRHDTSEKIVSVLLWTFSLFLILVTLHYGRRIFIAEQFSIPSASMKPTLVPGDKVWVNKLLFGSRIYTSFDFEDHAPLKSFRMPGIRKIRPGDVICFNYPLGYDQWTKIEFKINYVYCKRVLGTPGDTIGIKNGVNWNNNYKGTIGVLKNQLSIQNTPDSILWRDMYMATMPFTRPMWTVKNFGPLYVPCKGETLELDSTGRAIYGPVIEYETGSWPEASVTHHTFLHDYYFAVGDNSRESQDSRYWGFIPDDFIIGIVGGKKARNNPNQNDNVITFNHNIVKVGSIQIGDTAIAMFRFRNNSFEHQTVLFIPECDCTVVSPERLELAPKKRGAVSVSVRVDEAGEFNKYVFVQIQGSDESYTLAINCTGTNMED